MKYIQPIALFESQTRGTLISVDIQPEYEKWISFDLQAWGEWITSQIDTHDVILLYNGEDTVGMISLSEYQWWLEDTVGIPPEVIDDITFIDKGYAFFRSCMDAGVDDEEVFRFIRWLWDKGIRDAREMTEKNWEDFVSSSDVDVSDLRSFLEIDETFHIPELMDELVTLRQPLTLIGGGIEECLKEVELALMALDIDYNINHDWTY